ncbi:MULTISPECIES: ATP-binding protein [Ramlibacter]|uniref:histidine kinase n=1 Tax=Ramlibacter pinisoli TaxID=2682844 RepID=A0A6N8IXP6_9BURK|nr:MULTISPECIES: ATP-binding protein [Ramlibacter]MBA2961674.1 PAS domain-containing protein [Ramlibacter sp. CGMCC 1.13660]MVQ31617.1 PAS domain-containing protein [Ramlibacter pinisoli]
MTLPFVELPAFLRVGGELGGLIAKFSWASTSMGPVETWPPHVRTSVANMLRSEVAMVMLWGEDGVMIYNDAYSRFAGKRHPGLLGSKVREGWPEVAEFNDKVMRVGLTGGTLAYRDQELILHRDGRPEQVWMDLDYSPLVDADGNPAGVMAVVVETTEKVRATAHVLRERERIGQMFEQAPGFMAMLRGPQHVFEFANASYNRLVGHRPVLGLSVAEALPDAVAQGYVALLDQVFASGVAYAANGARFSVAEAPSSPPVERFVDFVYQPVRNEAGEVEGIFVEGVDVTERVAAERRRESLIELTARFQGARSVADVGFEASELLGHALGVSRVGYGSIDAERDTLHVERDWVKEGVESLAGVTPLRDYGSFIDSLKNGDFIDIPDVRLDPRTSVAAHALESKSARSFVNVPVLEDGRLVAVFFVNEDKARNWSRDVLALIKEVGERTRMAAERLRNEIALREAHRELEAKVEQRTRELMEVEARYRQSQKMEAIGQLTGGIAHDFNNLLHGLSLSLEMLRRARDGANPGQWSRYFDMADRSIKRAAALTQRMLAFSRRQTLDPKTVDLAHLVRGLEDLVRSTVGPSIAVVIECAADLWHAKVDPPQLESAILNLCINARDAMLPGSGKLTLALENIRLDARQAAQRELAAGDYVRLRVVDTGVGMSEEIRARVFDPFFTTKPQGEGTGLGLSMVYGFVRQSGGHVEVASQLGRGTSVQIVLPRVDGEAPRQSTAARSTPGVDGSGEVVLLVEDDPTIRPLLTEELERAGYHVIACARGAEGLSVLQSDARVDILVTDVGLPSGLNGRQVADGGRATRPALPVLFITGYADAAAAVGGGQLPEGMQVIGKPFEVAEFVRKVGAML